MTEAQEAIAALEDAQRRLDQDAASKALDRVLEVAMAEAEKRFPREVSRMSFGQLSRLLVAAVPVLHAVPRDLITIRLARRVFRATPADARPGESGGG